jgi:hypothetical protein
MHFPVNSAVTFAAQASEAASLGGMRSSAASSVFGREGAGRGRCVCVCVCMYEWVCCPVQGYCNVLVLSVHAFVCVCVRRSMEDFRRF